MINYTSLMHPKTLESIAQAMTFCTASNRCIIRNKHNEAYMVVSYVNGVYKFTSVKECKNVSNVVKKALRSVNDIRFKCLSYLVS